jgi:hypothetical protein
MKTTSWMSASLAVCAALHGAALAQTPPAPAPAPPPAAPATTGPVPRPASSAATPQAEAGEPRADTSSITDSPAGQTGDVNAAPSGAAQGARKGAAKQGQSGLTKAAPSGAASEAQSGPAKAAPGDPAKAAKPAGEGTVVKGGAKTDRLDLGLATVTGDHEQPKVLYIVPWKKADIGDLEGRPMNSLVDEILSPVDRDVFKREVVYYKGIQADTSQNGAPVAPAAKGEK